MARSFVAGTLAPDGVAEVDAHVASCAACSRLVQRLEVVNAETAADEPARTRPAATEPRTVGRYVVEGVLGKGGMGVVYRARDPELDRPVAVKLLLGQAAGADAAERLRREGRAIAKLAHSNVVAVYDVGTYDDSVFVAMELVDGGSLDRWLATRHPWREVLRVFLQAGEGLRAAHASGVVHRDFKPANVLVGKDGRVRVTDFGLARFSDEPRHRESARKLLGLPPAVVQVDSLGETMAAGSEASGNEPTLVAGSTGSVTDDKLTQTGALLGTPAYMSPEQFEAKIADEKSDQFSFAVSLYEALYGERPFKGNTVPKIYQAILDQEIATPVTSDVPSWLRQAVLRGMRAQPDERYASLDEMLAALRADPTVKRKRMIAGSAAMMCVGAALTGVYLFARSDDPALQCDVADASLQQTWNPARADAIEKAFVATGKPFAADNAKRVIAALDTWSREWAETNKASCVAKARGKQSENVFDLRTACLTSRRRDIDGLVAVFEKADGRTVERAFDATARLTNLADCSDVESLIGAAPMPKDPAVRAAISDADQQVSNVKAQYLAGKMKSAVADGERAVKAAEAIAWKPLEARALYWHGVALDTVGDSKAAAAVQSRAELAAEAGGVADLLASVRASRVHLLGRLNQPELALETAERAKVAIAKVGNRLDSDVDGDLEHSLGNVYWRLGKWDEALAHYERSRELYQRSRLANTLSAATVNNHVGMALREQGRFKEAEEWHRRGLAIAEKAVGPDHPSVGIIVDTLATALGEQGRLDEAIPLQRRVLALHERTLGPDSPSVAVACVNLGDSLRRIGQPKDTLPLLLRAREIFSNKLGAEHPYVAFTFHNEGNALSDLGDHAAARTAIARALAIRHAAHKPDHPDIAESYALLAKNELRAGKVRAGSEAIAKALAVLDAPAPPNKVLLGQALTTRGNLLLAGRETGKALADFERALTVFAEVPPSPRDLAEARVGAARAIFAMPKGDRERAKQLATQAKETLANEHAQRELELLAPILR